MGQKVMAVVTLHLKGPLGELEKLKIVFLSGRSCAGKSTLSGRFTHSAVHTPSKELILNPPNDLCGGVSYVKPVCHTLRWFL